MSFNNKWVLLETEQCTVRVTGPSVCWVCSGVLYLGLWVGQTVWLSESESRPLAKRCRFVSVCSIITRHSHGLLYVCEEERGRRVKRLSPSFLLAVVQPKQLPSGDQRLTLFLSHTHIDIYTLSAGLHPSDEWVTTVTTPPPPPLPSVRLCQTSQVPPLTAHDWSMKGWWATDLSTAPIKCSIKHRSRPWQG